jgi:glycosyltransferase involved in cell wall biosynthesis
MSKTPKVTVFMPVYNGETHLRDCINSILRQTYTDFEYLIIDDGSTDASVEVVGYFSDPRIRLIQNAKNMGIARTRNRGFELAQGEYVAFVDCDDICAPDRLEMQVQFMDIHPKVGFCGTWVQDIDEEGKLINGKLRTFPINNRKIREELLWGPSLWNPSLIMRKSVIEQYSLYHNPKYIVASDYDLWIRASRVTQFANLPKVLYYYRSHRNQISQRRSLEALQNVCSLQLFMLFELLRERAPEVKELLEPKQSANPEWLLKDLVALDEVIRNIHMVRAQPVLFGKQSLEDAYRLLWYKGLASLPVFTPGMYRAIQGTLFFDSLSPQVQWGLWLKCTLYIRQNWIIQLRKLRRKIKYPQLSRKRYRLATA